MRAMVLNDGSYRLQECPLPAPGAGEVLIRVAYAGVNRADLLQKQGRYPLPGGSPAIPGLEVAGEIEALGDGVEGWKKGDRVCALLSEGGYGEYAVAHSSLLLRVPESLGLDQAAALPEACFTVWISLVWQGRLQAGEVVLIHGGASGIGTVAIQVGRLLGARVFATAGSPEKCALAESLGAEKAIAYRSEDFVAVLKDGLGARGVDVILDMVGGDYFMRNLECLARGGRLCLIAFLKGAKMEANLGPILLKHLSVMGSTLRARPLEEKARIAGELKDRVWPAVESGEIKPVIDHVFPLAEAQKALSRMDQGLNLGKILLKV